jgi:nucleotidyltransferase/DNA polymerase involved in DNA repair
VLRAIAREFSPRYETHGDSRITIDLRGLKRLFGGPEAIGAQLAREARDRGVRAHIGIASTCTAAHLVALSRPGVTVVRAGDEAATLASLSLDLLGGAGWAGGGAALDAARHLATFGKWGLTTLGELAALPADGFTARVGRQGAHWQALARGEDLRPLVPDLPEEHFEGALDLEWPIDGIEPLSFVLTRLLEPLSARLERRDRGAAVLHVSLRLVAGAGAPHDTHVRRLALPSPIRDARALRTLALLDIESHPPASSIEAVSITIEPTPGRILQHTLFTRAVPTPDVLATLLARLAAVMGEDRVGAPASVDSYRPGAFVMHAFPADQERRAPAGARCASPDAERNPHPVSSALRRCRPPVPAQIALDDGRPVRLTTIRHGYATGQIVRCAGPWRTSGAWWEGRAGTAGAGRPGGAGRVGGGENADASQAARQVTTSGGPWDRDEWDVAMRDGTVYRIFRDGQTGGWFIDAWID